MKEFSVRMSNRPGQLAALARRLADAGVNIETLVATATDGDGMVRFVPNDEATTRTVLKQSGLSFTERVVLDTVLPDRPGALADLTERLAGSGVNIDTLYVMRSSADGVHLAIGVDDSDAASATLGA